MFPDIEKPLDARIVYEIMASTLAGIVGQILVLFFAVLFTAGFVPAAILAPWALLHLLNLLWRAKIVRIYMRALKAEKLDAARRQFRLYLVSLGVTSLLWAAMPLAIFWLPEEYHFLLYALVISLTFGSTIAIGPLTPVFMMYVLPMNLVTAGVLLFEGGRVHLGAAMFLPVALFFAAKSAKMHMLDYTALIAKESEATSLKEFFEHRAHHDALTGIANRFKLFDRFERILEEAKKSREPVAIFFLDLDRFKAINDRYGHPTGDRVLEAVGRRLREVLREGDLPARFAGDEFVVIVKGVGDREKLARIARKIRDAIAAPIVAETVTLRVTTSIGIALYPCDGETMEALIKAADTAMYRSKKEGLPFAFHSEKAKAEA